MHECQQKDLLNEMRKDIKTLLERTAMNSVKVTLMGGISGGVVAVAITILKIIGGQ